MTTGLIVNLIALSLVELLYIVEDLLDVAVHLVILKCSLRGDYRQVSGSGLIGHLAGLAIDGHGQIAIRGRISSREGAFFNAGDDGVAI